MGKRVFSVEENRNGRYATILAERDGFVLYHAGEQGGEQEHFAEYCYAPASKFWTRYAL